MIGADIIHGHRFSNILVTQRLFVQLESPLPGTTCTTREQAVSARNMSEPVRFFDRIFDGPGASIRAKSSPRIAYLVYRQVIAAHLGECVSQINGAGPRSQ